MVEYTLRIKFNYVYKQSYKYRVFMKRYWFCAKAVLYKKRGCFAWLHLLDLSWGNFGTVQQCFMNIQTIRIKKLLNPCDQKFHQLKYTHSKGESHQIT